MDTHVSSFHTPLTPPHTQEEKRSWLRLLRSRRVGVATFYRLMNEYRSASAAIAALPEVAAAAGVKDYSPCPEGVVVAELRAGAAAGAQLLAIGEPEYPQALGDIPDPPPLLWSKGDAAVAARPTLALVGARNASSLGLRIAHKLASDLGNAGWVIASGLARGIDTAAHKASVETGTIAVFAGGIDVTYPDANADLADTVAETGLILAEEPPGRQPQARHFPRRNRLISGLSKAVVVIEAAARSGSLITAETALAQGREVLVVPGHPLDPRAAGCLSLLRDGATLVRSADDILAALEEPDPAVQQSSERDEAAPTAQSDARVSADILAALTVNPVSEDQLLRDLATPAAQVAPAITRLEIDGRIRRLSGGLLALCA